MFRLPAVFVPPILLLLPVLIRRSGTFGDVAIQLSWFSSAMHYSGSSNSSSGDGGMKGPKFSATVLNKVINMEVVEDGKCIQKRRNV